MKTFQQEEALKYFKSHAENWQDKANITGEEKVNVIQQRNGFVLDVIKERSKTESVLDVGCGTGDLICDIAKENIKGIGVDFAQDMIDIASKKAIEAGLLKASFKCCSIFDFDFSKQKFDVISANGFIEYISLDELNQFFDLIYEALALKGSFVVGSRNRLFNIFTLNSFTEQELEGPDFKALVKESTSLASGTNIEKLCEGNIISFQKSDTKHAKTGINVTTRFQYTPAQLISMLNSRGLKPVELYPVHIHGTTPSFKDKFPNIHASISNLLQTHARNCPELIPYASTFMLHVQKN